MISDLHQTVELNIAGKIIPVWVYGNPKNPPIVYVHGLYRPFSSYIGDLPMRHTKDHFYFICFDLPGEGKSKEIKMDNLEFIDLVINKIVPNKKVTMFGYSYGGLLSLMFAARYSDRVKELIISGTPVMFSVFKIYEVTKYIPLFIRRRLIEKYSWNLDF